MLKLVKRAWEMCVCVSVHNSTQKSRRFSSEIQNWEMSDRTINCDLCAYLLSWTEVICIFMRQKFS